MNGTVSELITGMIAGVGLITITVGFPPLLEKSADVICGATQKIGKRFTKISRSKHRGKSI